MKKIPADFTEYPETVMSNFDHQINKKVAEKLKKGELYAQYSGWNFCGYVWYEDNKWNCEIWVYHSHIDTITAETLEEIMETVSDKYGYK